jgi:GDPmannose 4,6-dehydratase
MGMKRALITGLTGQDGSYLSELLLHKGYQVYALVRRSSNDPFVRFDNKDVPNKVRVVYGDLRDNAAVERAVEESQPDEVYNLAAQSDVGISFRCPEETVEINQYGLGRLVNAVLRLKPDAKIYHASTGEMFGRTEPPQNEHSPFQPVSPYGESKLRAYEDYVLGYRQRHGLFICSGILFNHESPRRGQHFVTRKITISLSKILLGLQQVLTLGNLDAVRDWGFAGDYVEAIWLMLQQPNPRDYIIATGATHTVRDFVNAAARELGMRISWSGKGLQELGRDEKGNVIVRVNEKFYRPAEVNYLCGDPSKARRELAWQPKVSFQELVAMMVRADLAVAENEAAKNRLGSAA